MDKIRKVIPALDVTDLEKIKNLIRQIDGNDLIYGYKVGFALSLTFGLPRVVEVIRSLSQKPIIYDHQKAATDIPATGKLFAKTLKNSGVDEVILFPQAGPATLIAWVNAGLNENLKVIVGGIMTHPQFVASEGGFINDEAITRIYRMAYDAGVWDFVVPLTKAQATKTVYNQAYLNERCNFYSPGYGKQGGDVRQFDFLKNHYIIIGRSLLNADNPGVYLKKVSKELDLIE